MAKMVTLDSAIAPEPRLYTVLLGDSADTRKSTALRMADEFFRPSAPRGPCPCSSAPARPKGSPRSSRVPGPGPPLRRVQELRRQGPGRAQRGAADGLDLVRAWRVRQPHQGEEDLRPRRPPLPARRVYPDTYATLFDHQFHAIGFLNRLWLVADRSTARSPSPPPLPLGAVDAFRQTVRARLADLDRAYARTGCAPSPTASRRRPGAASPTGIRPAPAPCSRSGSTPMGTGSWSCSPPCRTGPRWMASRHRRGRAARLPARRPAGMRPRRCGEQRGPHGGGIRRAWPGPAPGARPQAGRPCRSGWGSGFGDRCGEPVEADEVMVDVKTTLSGQRHRTYRLRSAARSAATHLAADNPAP